MTAETLIQPTRMARSLQLGDLWRHRELLRLFVWRAISARYRQMALGAVWALLEPMVMLLMMIVVFGMLLRLPTDGYPYPVFAYAALMPWMLFSKATLGAVESLKENIGVISKVYFPRIILPISAVVKEL